MREVLSSKGAKKRVAIAAANLVKDGQVVGLGTGSTANYMVEELGRRIREEKLGIVGVPTSNATAELAQKHGISLTTLSEHPRLDIAIDGADQVDPKLDLIKGMGGALTREKIVDGASGQLIIIVDEGKVVSRLGACQVIPVEVVPFAIPIVESKLRDLGGRPSVRQSKDGRGKFITDNCNNILDVDFGEIDDARRLERAIKLISGVVESGLFVDMVRTVFVGGEDGIRTLEKNEGQ